MTDRPDPRPSIAEAERRLVVGVSLAFLLELGLFFLAGAALMLLPGWVSWLWEAWSW